MSKKTIDSDDAGNKAGATMALSSTINAAVLIQGYTEHFGHAPLIALMDNLASKHAKIKQGDCQEIEEILFDQAHVLQAIFSRLAYVALHSSCIQSVDTYLRLAFKAQAQGTKTLATLHSIKYPSSTSFIKQTNIGENVQVNNSLGCDQDSQEKISKSSNKLLEEPKNDTRLDPRTTNEASCSHPHLEAVR